MLGPLPRLYRIIVSVIALAVFVAAGVWAAFALPYPRFVSVGATIGLAAGVLCSYFLLHQSRRAQSTETTRDRRHRLR